MKAVFTSARAAQRRWEARPLRGRIAWLRDLRVRLAEHATALARVTALPNDRPVAEKLVCEVIPLLAAIRFLEREAAGILRPRKLGRRGRPVWLGRGSLSIARKPFGVVLIVGPQNYPLFLPGVQMLQALVAGNAVLLKPAAASAAPLRWLVDQLLQAGVPDDLVQILPEPPAAAQEAVREGVDKVIFTGSSENGRDLLGLMARRNIPGVLELSGADAVIVRQDADLERAARAITFGKRLNAGETCMAPALILAHETVLAGLTTRLAELSVPDVEVFSFARDEEAVAWLREREHGLGASIFSGDEAVAQRLAREIPAGFVTINDLIVPTADPRFPFGGTRASGYGTTRGAEGLLEMTYPQAVAVRRGRWLPHLDEAKAGDLEIFAAFVRLTYGRGRMRWRALGDFWRAARRRHLPTNALSGRGTLKGSAVGPAAAASVRRTGTSGTR